MGLWRICAPDAHVSVLQITVISQRQVPTCNVYFNITLSYSRSMRCHWTCLSPR